MSNKSIGHLCYAAMCHGATNAMTKEQLQELTNWETENLDGDTVGTMDWPGWIPLIGLPPWVGIEEVRTKKKSISQKLRVKVFERDRYRCLGCGTWKSLSIDHIIPESSGGPTVFENLQTLCRSCNSRKGVK